MSIPTQEGLAGLRLLVCMAKADGVLKPEERFVLEDALAGLTLPDNMSLERLLDETGNPTLLAAQISSQEGRDSTYASVYALALCDREVAAAEDKILQTLRDAWGISKTEEAPLAQTLNATLTVPSPAQVHEAVPEGDARKAEFERVLHRYCLLCSITGAIPIPLLPDLMVVPLQVKMVHDIAGIFGQRTNSETVSLMLKTLGVGTGARLGISALCKLVPGWGSAVGAATSFASTFALGKVAWAYFQAEGKVPVEQLKPLFQEASRDGRSEFQKHKDAVGEAQQAHGEKLRQLAYDLQQGKITQEEYERRLDALE